MAHKNMVDLGRKLNFGDQPVSLSASKNKVIYPSLYIRKDIGLTEKDAGKEIVGIVKLKVTSVAKTIDEKGTRHTADFDVLGINLKPKVSHYKRD